MITSPNAWTNRASRVGFKQAKGALVSKLHCGPKVAKYIFMFFNTGAADEVLKVLKLDYLKGRNTADHNTSKYIHSCLIVRRSGKFNLDLYFKDRAYNPSSDKICLEFSVGM